MSAEYLQFLFGLHGKTALVTGGTRGIGRGLSLALASAGCNLVLLARNPDDGYVQSLAQEVQSLGRRVVFVKCDLSSKADVSAIVQSLCVEQKLQIDILVHSGGIQHRSPAELFPDSAWDDVLNVNLTAGFLLSRDFARYWFAESVADGVNLNSPGNRKKIIFIASVTTFTGSVQIPAYVSSKAAIGGLTKALSNEWAGKGINVNAIAPGYIATDLTRALREEEVGDIERQRESELLARVPAGRWGLPEDLAGAVVHLAARSSDFISGEIHVVDGGFCGR